MVFSRNFQEHVQHLDTMLGRLTTGGVTINASKYKFCQTKISFLSHEISQTGISEHPKRTAAILNYPVPKNQRELRQFLGTCNFHHRFIVNYSPYVATLLSLMKKGQNGTGRLNFRRLLKYYVRNSRTLVGSTLMRTFSFAYTQMRVKSLLVPYCCKSTTRGQHR